jgi:uncharacterized lipoprotein
VKLTLAAVTIATAFFLSGCAGTFSGSKDAYLKDSGSTPKTHNTDSVQLKEEKQYLPSEDELINPNYAPPSMEPPPEEVTSVNPHARLTGPQDTVLLLQSDTQVAWRRVAEALKKTPYLIMDEDETLHSYFIIDKVKTGGSIQKQSPIYQLTLSSVGNDTELHLLDAKNSELDPQVANRIMKAIQKYYI